MATLGEKHPKAYLYFITAISAMGGLLFGYDWVLVGGAKPFYEVFFEITNSPALQGWVMGSAILGCLIGVMISGGLSDRFGRRPLMFVAALIFIVAAIGTGAVSDLNSFIFYRILGGIGIGIASTLSPMYIAEVAPSNQRGQFVSLNQMTIVIGILAAQIVNWLIAEPVLPGEDILNSWNGQMGWRIMFWVGGIPAVAFFILLFFIPESPRWLSSAGRLDKAQQVFSIIGGKEYGKQQVQLVLESLSQKVEKIDFKYLFKGRMFRVLIIGIFIAIFQQWCGINVVFNYAQEIFEGAGYGVSDVLFNIVITGVINVLFTLVGMYTVDKLGRRTLMLFGSIGLTLSYAALGACYYFEVTGVFVLIFVLVGIACYAMTLAPVTWVVLSEIFPTKIRGLAMSIATFALWTACFILTYTFPLLNAWLGASGTFWLYGVICVIGFFFLKSQLPETKGKSLEEIEDELLNK